jgi:Flp pilus assembly protein TadD
MNTPLKKKTSSSQVLKRSIVNTMISGFVVIVTMLVAWLIIRVHFQWQSLPTVPGSIGIVYPSEGSIFPPEFPAPTVLWSDPENKAVFWEINITFSDSSPVIRTESSGERMHIGEIDQRCTSQTNKLPELTPEQAVLHTWAPDTVIWSSIKKHSVNHPAIIVITGHPRGDTKKILSRGQVSIQTSRDSVGAPIYYRDVPLMPSESEKGVIKPLVSQALPLIAWRIRRVGDLESRVLMEGLHTCVNCHSFSADGKTLGLDMDGPQNDKGLYGIVKVKPQMTIRNEDLIAWSTFRGKLGSKLRVGFMSQISPDSRYVITTVNDPGIDQTDYLRRKNPIDLAMNYYVANFKDYHFLQVFYPTRGVLAWYNRESAHLKYLPGADDTRYVQTNAVWSPDGKYLIFARAPARDAYPADARQAQHANDPNETQIQFDLYRIAFNDGNGGVAEPIVGASQNGMSNSFPKVSPDGHWIVFVQARNGLLMRPDAQLYIVSVKGGTAHRMKCNTPLMNSWHSFSPNGRWLVFSSKSRSPYTQMFLTHIDESGDDSPPILIENATAANRAVNIPEFVNIPPDGMLKIDAPAAEYTLHMDLAVELAKGHQYEAAVLELNKALELAPAEPRLHNRLGIVLSKIGMLDEAMVHYRKTLTFDPYNAEAYNNIGDAFARKDSIKEAIAQFEKAVQLDTAYANAYANLGMMLARTGQTDKAIVNLRKVVELRPDGADARRDLGHALLDKGDFGNARLQLEEALRLAGRGDPLTVHLLGRAYSGLGSFTEDSNAQQEALSIAIQQNNRSLIQLINDYISRE